MPPAIEFIFELRQWELANLALFCEGELAQRIFLTLATAKHKRTVLRLTEVFIDGCASEVGIRKRLRHYQKLGLIEVVPNPVDRRTKLVQPTQKLEELLTAHYSVARELWRKNASMPSANQQ